MHADTGSLALHLHKSLAADSMTAAPDAAAPARRSGAVAGASVDRLAAKFGGTVKVTLPRRRYDDFQARRRRSDACWWQRQDRGVARQGAVVLEKFPSPEWNEACQMA